MRAWIGLVVAGCAASVFACGGKAESGTNGGNTSWLEACDTQAECGEEHACIHRVCLPRCEQSADCQELDSRLRCGDVASLRVRGDSCEAIAPALLCLLTCTGDDDCAAMGDDYACNGGACRPACDKLIGEGPNATDATDSETEDSDSTSDDDDTDVDGTDTTDVDPAGDTDTIPTDVEPVPTDTPDADDGCVAVIDGNGGCCPDFTAVTLEQLAADECLIPTEGADPEAVWEKLFVCLDACPGGDCVPLELRSEFYAVGVPSGGGCELAPACDDGSCPGSPCDPTLGCAPQWSCDTPACQAYATSLGCTGASSCTDAGRCEVTQDTGCDGNYDPVCGCDGLTYGNACEIGVETISHAGECATCYSPEDNLELAYSGMLDGCACDEATDADVCAFDDTGRAVALVCQAERWQVVEDGPCEPMTLDECVVAIDLSDCCFQQTAARSSSVASDPCLAEAASFEHGTPGTGSDCQAAEQCALESDCPGFETLYPSAAPVEDGGACILGVSSCSFAGQSCAGADCCDDLYCVDSVCRTEPAACAMPGQSCARSDCCDGLSCVDSVCVEQPAGCVGLSGNCSAGSPCCLGLSCQDGTCSEQ